MGWKKFQLKDFIGTCTCAEASSLDDCFSYASMAPEWTLRDRFLAWWAFRIFLIYFFCARGGGRGSPRRWDGCGGSGFFFLSHRRRGEGPGREGPRGQEGVCSDFGEFFFGGGG